VGDVVTTRPRPTSDGRTQSRLARDRPWAGEAVTPCLRPPSSGRHIHALPEAALGRETQSWLARGQPRAGDTVTPCPRPSLGWRCSHTSPEATLRGRRSHVLPEANFGRETPHGSSRANLGRETQSRLVRGLPQAGDVVTACLRPPLDWRRSHGSPRGHPRAGDIVKRGICSQVRQL
jgi:hypothetical protein